VIVCLDKYFEFGGSQTVNVCVLGYKVNRCAFTNFIASLSTAISDALGQHMA